MTSKKDDLEAYRLKYDAELQQMRLKIELAKMEHQWAQENSAQTWNQRKKAIKDSLDDLTQSILRISELLQ